MNKRVRVNYRESSKQVTPDVTIEYTDPTGKVIVNDEILLETYELFQKAQKLMMGRNIEKIKSGRNLP